MNNTAISVKNLSKTFEFSTSSNKSGFFKKLLKREKKIIKAVDDITFEVKKGETVAFIGPNGAGKSTTIKMMTGILYPTSGDISVLGLNPQKNRSEMVYKIGVLFGQRSQLIFNLPLSDSFELFAKLYNISKQVFKNRFSELVEIFDLTEFVDQSVRKLSLGQRMRAEIALCLIHAPDVIFLDEPTIGLDITSRQRLRLELKKMNERENVTIFLTSHDVGDIEALCERTMIINNGKLVIDSSTRDLKKDRFNTKIIKLELKEPLESISLDGFDYTFTNNRFIEIKLDTSTRSINSTIKMLLDKFSVNDIDVNDPSLETIISQIYENEKQK